MLNEFWNCKKALKNRLKFGSMEINSYLCIVNQTKRFLRYWNNRQYCHI